MKKITDKQGAILKYVWDFLEDRHYQPSVKDVMKEFGYSSPATVTLHLKALEQKGYIKSQHKARALIFKEQGLYFLKHGSPDES